MRGLEIHMNWLWSLSERATATTSNSEAAGPIWRADSGPLIGAIVACLFASNAGAQDSWVERITTPEARSYMALAEDPIRDRIVLFGGRTPSSNLGDTWEWDGDGWIERTTTLSPSARQDAALVWDGARQRALLFGGFDGSKRDDTWEWDGLDWIQLSPTHRPGARNAHATAFDGARSVVVLFGGATSGPVNDTWEWNGNDWTQRLPANSPSPRAGVAMAHDVSRGRTVMFGGNNGVTSNAETWEWDGTNWSQRYPVDHPGPRSRHSMTWDSATQRVILFGGVDDTGQDYADTWEWDGSNWSLLTPVASPNPPRYGTGLAYHSATDRTVLFGGSDAFNGATALSDTWELSRNGQGAWVERRTTPEARSYMALAEDPVRGSVVLFGGRTPSDNLGDTWEWDGDGWTERTTTQSPSPRQDGSLVWDGARQRVLLFGGFDGAKRDDTWEWDGLDWIQLSPTHRPGARNAHAAAFDGARSVVVLFGGATSGHVDDTWEWNGNDWSQRFPANSPSPRAGLAMAHDVSRGCTVLFGGNNGVNSNAETWEWDGSNWSQRYPVDHPGPRSRHSMTWDSATQRVILFGGVDDVGQDYADTWEWDGSNWSQLAPVASPDPARYGAGLAYHSATDRALLFGGTVDFNGATALSDTWELIRPDTTPPTADAGTDQSIHAGDPVQLSGVHSFDDTTASVDLLFSWSLTVTPGGSAASLNDPTEASPSFLADLPGEFRVQLIVTDEAGNTSVPDEVVVSSFNLAPTADAGQDLVAITGTTAHLDGNGSHDPDGDPITLDWELVASPAGSTTALSGATTPTPSFTPDVPGEYTVTLIVNDSIVSSAPDFVTVIAINGTDFFKDKIMEAREWISTVPKSSFSAPGHRNFFTENLSKVAKLADGSNLDKTRDHLQRVLERTDGVVVRGTFDPKGKAQPHAADFLTEAGAQITLHGMLTDALNAIAP